MTRLEDSDKETFLSFWKKFSPNSNFITYFKNNNIYPSHPVGLFKELEETVYTEYENETIISKYCFFDNEMEQVRVALLVACGSFLALKHANFIFEDEKLIVIPTVRYKKGGSYSRLCHDIDDLKEEIIRHYDSLIWLASIKFGEDYRRTEQTEVPLSAVSNTKEPNTDNFLTPGTKWETILVTFLRNGDTFLIKNDINNGRVKEFHYADAGVERFKDGRSRNVDKPSVLYKFFKDLYKYNGFLPFRSQKPSEKDKLKKAISDLRRVLKSITSLNSEDPFEYKSAREEGKGYKIKFKIIDPDAYKNSNLPIDKIEPLLRENGLPTT